VDDPLRPLLDLPGVTASVDQARAAVDALLGNRALRRRSADVSTESSVRGAWAAAVLAGSTAELAAVRSGAAGDDPLVQGALRAQGAIGPLADTWSRAPRQALARLHALAAADLVPADALGRPRAGADRLDTLAAVLAVTSAPAIAVGALVHGEIAALDAFAPVSPLVGLTGVRLTLVARGLDPKSLVVVEAGHLELRAEYDSALAGYRSGEPDGVAGWIRYSARAIEAGAVEASAICQALTRG
jgi:hypothetical protein